MATQLSVCNGSAKRKRDKKAEYDISKTGKLLQCLVNNYPSLSTSGLQQLDEETGYAPIHDAASNDKTETVKALIEADSSLLECLTAHKETPILIGCLCGCLNVVKYLHNRGAELQCRTSNNSTAIHYAASSGSDRTLRYVLSRDRMAHHINSTNNTGDTPAHCATRAGCVECVRVLRDYGADFSLRNRLSQTPRDIAKALGNEVCLAEVCSAVCEPTSTVDGIPSDHRDNLRNYDLRHLPIPPPESHRKAEDHHVDYHNFKEGRDVVIPPLQPMKPKLKNGRSPVDRNQGRNESTVGERWRGRDQTRAERRDGESERRNRARSESPVYWRHSHDSLTGSLRQSRRTPTRGHDSFTRSIRQRSQTPTESKSERKTDSHEADWAIQPEQTEGNSYCHMDNVQAIIESGYRPVLGATHRPEIPIVIKKDLPSTMEVKCGEEVTLNIEATTNSSSQMKYSWYEKRGKHCPLVGEEEAELKWKIQKKRPVKVFCRIYLRGREDNCVNSATTTIIPKLVCFTSKLHIDSEGQYYGKKAVLKCQAEKHDSVEGEISYSWLKRISATDNRYDPVKEQYTSELHFDALCPEHDGYYICQADVKGDFVSSNVVHIQGCIEPTFQITKQPRSRVVDEGSSFTLQCRAEFKAGITGTLEYQWYHNETAIRGANSAIHARHRAVAGDTGQYYCKVSGDAGANRCTESATVALAYKEEQDTDAESSSPQQLDQIKALKILRTSEGKRYACDKVAVVIGNAAYVHHRKLSSSVADVRILKTALSKAGFKVISLVDMNCAETMHALKLVSDLLVAGVYVVFAYSGHGCRIHTDYIIPVDASYPIDPVQCIACDTVCEHLQSKLCRVFLIMNCCRSVAEGSKTLPLYKCSNNYGNRAILTASTEGHQAYEVNGAPSNFIEAFSVALEGGGGYRQVFDAVLEKFEMTTNCDVVRGGTFAKPTSSYSVMDKEIAFQDDIMLNDETLEATLDRLQEICTAVNTPPDEVTLTEELGTELQEVKLSFKCDFSNVLLVLVKWSMHPSATQTVCTVDMSQVHVQGVVIERCSMEMQAHEACFSVSSLQRLSGNLRLHLTFTISSSDTRQHTLTVTHNLASRPLYAQVSHL